MSASDQLKDGMGRLARVALEILPEMFDAETGLFSNKTTVSGGVYVNAAPNVLYSAASLAGILSQERVPADRVVPLGRALDTLRAQALERDRTAELGLYAWVGALAGDRQAAAAVSQLAAREPRNVPSGALGMALRGLTAAAAADSSLRDRALATARAWAAELIRRYEPSLEVFRASPRRRLPRRELIEHGLTSFASQVYPLQGLASLYELTGETPPDSLRRVAARQVELQGPLGQWWWIWSTRRRVILEGYPVYSVHQDAMAFMGLLPVQALALGDYVEPLALGLEWVFGVNELGVPLLDGDPPLIYRCIQRAGSDADGPYGLSATNFRQVVLRSLAPSRAAAARAAHPSRLEVLPECRSYHLGWVLYADSLVQALGP